MIEESLSFSRKAEYIRGQKKNNRSNKTQY